MPSLDPVSAAMHTQTPGAQRRPIHTKRVGREQPLPVPCWQAAPIIVGRPEWHPMAFLG